MNQQDAVVVEAIASVVDGAQDPWLENQTLKALEASIDSQAAGLGRLSSDGQIAVLGLSMRNFGVFAALMERLDLLPEPLKYALVSKGMYEMGACGMPPEYADEVETLLAAVEESYWSRDDTENAAYEYRETVVSNPKVGPWPLLDEYQNCGDTDLLMAILQNPICPETISRAIAERKHFLFDDYVHDSEELDGDEEDLEKDALWYLIEQAEANLKRASS